MDGDWSIGDLDGMCVVDAVWLKLVQHHRRFGCRNTSYGTVPKRQNPSKIHAQGAPNGFEDRGPFSTFEPAKTGMDLAGCFVVIAGAGLPAVAALSPKYNNLLWHCLASSFLVKTHQTTLSKILRRRLLKPPSGTIT